MAATLLARVGVPALAAFACLSVSAVALAKPAVEVLGSYEGVSPESGLVIDPQNERVLYGATNKTFQSPCGSIYKIELSNDAAAKIIGYSAFKLNSQIAPQGCAITGALAFHNGTLYGVLNGGNGSIFKYDRNGDFGMVHLFKGSVLHPMPGLIADGDGNLYGTTRTGGTKSNRGVIFKVTPHTGALSIVASLGGDEGVSVENGLVFGPDGWLYGVTSGGPRYGSVLKVSTSGELKVVHAFTQRVLPMGRLSFDAVGNLYGTSTTGGANDTGFIYKVTAEGKYSVVYSFTKTQSGGTSQRITIGQDGYLYGASTIVFRLNPITYDFETLHTFATYSKTDLTVDSQGRLYGATLSSSKPHEKFEIFRITP